MKTCKKCGTDKPLNSYTSDPRYKDGLYPWCFECRKAWRDARKERQQELHSNWSEQNRDRVRELGNQNYARHKDEYSAKRREYGRERWANDPEFRQRKNEQDRIRKLKKRRGYQSPALLQTVPYDGPTKTCLCCLDSLPLYAFQKNQTAADGLQAWCGGCRKVHADDPVRKQQKIAYDQHRRAEKGDDLRAQSRERYRTDPEYRERIRSDYMRRKNTPEHRERERQRHYKRWADPAFRQRSIDRLRTRRHTDPEYRRKVWHWRQVRRARIQTQGVPFTEVQWVALCERYNHCCLACGERKPLTVDHVVPISRGGSSDISNVQPLCLDCNRRKNARTVDYRT